MTRIIILIGLLSLMQDWAEAQERSFGTLPLISKSGANAILTSSKIDSTEYRRVLNIYNRLVQARGDFRFPVPSFSLVGQVEKVAGVNYAELSIFLEERALAVCNSFNADADAAIAFLLAHELTHYYEKHAWRRGFVEEYKDLKIGIDLKDIPDKVINETEADYLGGFLAYSAGYGLFKRGADIIQSLYSSYGFDKKLPNYPSLSDRQALSERTAVRLANLVNVFEMANLLSAIGKYSLAYEYYRFLLFEYQSREIYNNLGVTATLDAMEKTGTQKFRYPLEMDLESSAAKAGMPGLEDPKTKEKFRQAILLFDAAISLDPNYAPAYLNKATVYALMGDWTRARFYANIEARQASKVGNYPKVALDIDVLMGIIEASSNNAKAAQALFTKAEKAGSALARINLRVLLKQAPLKEIPPTPTLAQEKIENLSVGDLANNLVYPKDIGPVRINRTSEFLQNPSIGPSSILFINLLNNDEKIFFHLTNPGYAGKTARDIGIGDPRASIVTKYGEPARSLETPRGQIMVYQNILFIIGKDGKLERWANFK